MTQDAPVLKIEVRDIASKAPMGPWKKLPGGSALPWKRVANNWKREVYSIVAGLVKYDKT